MAAALAAPVVAAVVAPVAAAERGPLLSRGSLGMGGSVEAVACAVRAESGAVLAGTVLAGTVFAKFRSSDIYGSKVKEKGKGG